MSSTNKTTHYELPQFVENDIFNPLVDDNDAYVKIDTALYNIADAEADDAAEIVSIKGRLDTAEGKVDTLETQNGTDVLTTVAQTLSGAVNELKSGEDSLDGRLDVIEDDINNANTGLKVKVDDLGTRMTSAEGDIDALEAQNGNETLVTSSSTLSGAINEIANGRPYITPEMYGAVGDGTTDDADAIQSAIVASVANGVALIFKAKTYKIGHHLNVPAGAKLLGSTVAHNYQGSYKFTMLDAYMGDYTEVDNTRPILNIDNRNYWEYNADPSSRREEVFIENITLKGNGAFCGIKCNTYSSHFFNITVIGCEIGIYMHDCYTTYLDKICCFVCSIGMFLRANNSNGAIRDCWINYGNSAGDNENLSSKLTTKINALDTDKLTAIYAVLSGATLENVCIENSYYGIFACRNTTIHGTNVHTEQILTDGAAVATINLYNTIDTIKLDKATFWNDSSHGGAIAKSGYKSIIYIQSDNDKPTYYADPIRTSYGISKFQFKDGELYLPITLSNVTNAVITNNHTKFDENGNIVLDFVLADYDSYDNTNPCIVTIGTLASDKGYVTTDGSMPIMGSELQIGFTYQSITENGTGAYKVIPKHTRIYAAIPYKVT